MTVLSQQNLGVLENTSLVTNLDLGRRLVDAGKEICAEAEALEGPGVTVTKPVGFTLMLGKNLTTETIASQGDKLEVGSIAAGDDGNGSYRIRVSDNANPFNPGAEYFFGTVFAGEMFTAIASTGGRSTFGAETYVHIFDDNGAILQSIKFHTSCSAPLVIGDLYGSVTLSGAAVHNLDTGERIDIGATLAPGDDGVTYTVVGGADAALFTVDFDTGTVAFITPPDFENPLDNGSDNTYLVTIRASRGDGSFTDAPLAVSIENQQQPGPAITGTPTEDQTLTADTSGISDGDGLGAFSYQWMRDGVDIGGATGSTYVLGDADVGTAISVKVSYTDGNGTAEGPLTSAATPVSPDMARLFGSNADTAKGLASAYETLLAGVPNEVGFFYLINTAVSTNYGAGPGVVFNQENIFINLINNLVQGNAEAKARFDALATGSTLQEKVASLYSALIPASKQTADGLAFITRADGLKFYQDVAAERGVAGTDGAAIVSLASLLKIAVTGDFGIGNSVNDLIKAVGAGSAAIPAAGTTLTALETADGTAFDADDAVAMARIAVPATSSEVYASSSEVSELAFAAPASIVGLADGDWAG